MAVDLEKLQNKIDEVFSKETPESLMYFFKESRNPKDPTLDEFMKAQKQYHERRRG